MTDDIKRTIRYDDRRKILSVKTEEDQELKKEEVNGGNMKMTTNAEYNEAGIRMILQNAQTAKDQAEKTIPQLQDRMKELEEDIVKYGNVEMTPDLIALEEQLKKIKTFKDSQPKRAELENIKQMLNNAEKNLKQTNKDIQEIRNEIGGRLNL